MEEEEETGIGSCDMAASRRKVDQVLPKSICINAPVNVYCTVSYLLPSDRCDALPSLYAGDERVRSIFRFPVCSDLIVCLIVFILIQQCLALSENSPIGAVFFAFR